MASCARSARITCLLSSRETTNSGRLYCSALVVHPGLAEKNHAQCGGNTVFPNDMCSEVG